MDPFVSVQDDKCTLWIVKNIYIYKKNELVPNYQNLNPVSASNGCTISLYTNHRWPKLMSQEKANA